MGDITFWYSIGSTYTYLTVMRMRAMAERAGATVEWRPFDVREIMVRQNNIPFRDKPVKAAYMWRDLERRAGRHGLPVRVPAPYPLAELARANRVACLGRHEGWGEAYTVETYRRWFLDGEPPGEAPNLQGSLAALGLDARQVIARADAPGMERALAESTAEAEASGVFGSPSFVVAGELFWGDDRLEDAMDWLAGVRGTEAGRA